MKTKNCSRPSTARIRQIAAEMAAKAAHAAKVLEAEAAEVAAAAGMNHAAANWTTAGDAGFRGEDRKDLTLADALIGAADRDPTVRETAWLDLAGADGLTAFLAGFDAGHSMAVIEEARAAYARGLRNRAQAVVGAAYEHLVVLRRTADEAAAAASSSRATADKATAREGSAVRWNVKF